MLTTLRSIFWSLWPSINLVLASAQVLLINLAKCVFAAAVVFAAIWAVKRFLRRSLKNTGANHDTLYSVLSSLLTYAGYLLVAFQVLHFFGVSAESILAVAGIGSIAIGFGAKGIAEDVITGASILLENQFLVGDTIEINGKTGTVETIGLRITTIRSYDGDVHIFPNSTIKLVTNMSKSFNRAVVNVPVSNRENIDRALAVLADEMSRARLICGAMISDPVVQGVVDINVSNTVIRVIVDCAVGENWAVERELRRLIKTRFDKEHITPLYKKETDD